MERGFCGKMWEYRIATAGTVGFTPGSFSDCEVAASVTLRGGYFASMSVIAAMTTRQNVNSSIQVTMGITP